MAGLLDMYRLAGNEQALEIVKRAANWFLRYTEDIKDEQMAQMMWEETGGLMELLETEENPLVNMHANSTVPEIMGAARAYEVTGEERHRRLVERYWEIAVDKSGMFVT